MKRRRRALLAAVLLRSGLFAGCGGAPEGGMQRTSVQTVPQRSLRAPPPAARQPNMRPQNIPPIADPCGRQWAGGIFCPVFCIMGP